MSWPGHGASPDGNKHRSTLLWRISCNHAPGYSFLFGTMHVRDSRVFSVLPPVLPSLQACQCYAAEYHLDDQPANLLPPVPAGASWQAMLPAARFSRIHRLLLRVAGLDLRCLTHLPPYFAVGVLSEQFLKADMPCSLDQHLWDFAKEAGKELRGVETLEEQMQVLAGIPAAVQLRMLLDCCRNISGFRQHLLHLADLYERQDVQLLYKVVKKNARGLRKALLYRRNAVMAGRIAALAKEQTTFASIGAAHLGGSKGVICLLRRQGFRVQPVFAAPAR